ncbi:OmpA family protein [bacterium]|nr:OmpA family protein [bacterium]
MDKILFDSGKAVIKSDGKRVLDKISSLLLNKYPDRQIRVEGHTDNVPISGVLQNRFPTNWELSTARATAAVRYLQEKNGVDSTRLASVGFGQYHPIDTNDTPEGKARNRRIEIVLLPPEPEIRE